MEIKIYINDENIMTKMVEDSIKNPKSAYSTADKMVSDIARERVKDMDIDFDSPLDYIPYGFTIRTRNVLKSAGIYTYRDLISYTESEFVLLRNCGRKTLTEMQDRLKIVGLEFKKN